MKVSIGIESDLASKTLDFKAYRDTKESADGDTGARLLLTDLVHVLKE